MTNDKLTAKQKANLRTLQSKQRAYMRRINEVLYFKKTHPWDIEFEEEVRINAVLKELRAKRDELQNKINDIFKEASICQQ